MSLQQQQVTISIRARESGDPLRYEEIFLFFKVFNRNF